MSLISKVEVLETYADLYDVFDDNKEIIKELHKVYDKINGLAAAQTDPCSVCKWKDEHPWSVCNGCKAEGVSE